MQFVGHSDRAFGLEMRTGNPNTRLPTARIPDRILDHPVRAIGWQQAIVPGTLDFLQNQAEDLAGALR
jgi:hypothetical protein